MTETLVDLAAMHRHGFVVARTSDLEGFRRACASLGKITQETQVRLKADGKFYTETPNAVPFHTDHPYARFVAWHCVEQDEMHGEQMLVDTRPYVQRLGPEECDRLATATLRVLHSEMTHPILSRDTDRIYWVPVLIREKINSFPQHVQEAILNFSHYIGQPDSESNAACVRLRPGESIFVDNNRVVHGRRAIAGASKRHLVRAYIKE